MTTITQTISTFSNPINRDTQTPAEISVAGDTTIEEWTTIVGEMNTYAEQVNAVKTEMTASQVAAALSETNADNYSDIAMASANFAGNYSDLTGALTVPSSVYHLSRYWMLLSDLADVTAKVPGTDVEWAEVYSDHSLNNIFMLGF